MTSSFQQRVRVKSLSDMLLFILTEKRVAITDIQERIIMIISKMNII